jgi:signal transduction histidine kinase
VVGGARTKVLLREEVTRFNEAIDEAIAESVSHYAEEVERWRNIFLGVLGPRLAHAPQLDRDDLAADRADGGRCPDRHCCATPDSQRRAHEQLLDKLLVYNRAQMGMGFEVVKTDVDLAHECREEIELLQASMPDIRIHFEAPASLRGMFDAGHIREALANLVVNAQKYGTRGGEIRVELREGDNGTELEVGNPGAAIPREVLDLMFEPLRRGGVFAGEAEQASLGLGLFIVSQIAQAHAGTIRAESVEGTTTFKLHLPRA